MRIFITGSNGFVGTNLGRFLLNEGHEVTGLVRSEAKGKTLPKGASYVVGEGTQPGKWQEAVSGHDVLINLAGVPIFQRWTDAYKTPSLRHTNPHDKKSGGCHSRGKREFGYSAEHFRRGLLRIYRG